MLNLLNYGLALSDKVVLSTNRLQIYHIYFCLPILYMQVHDFISPWLSDLISLRSVIFYHAIYKADNLSFYLFME